MDDATKSELETLARGRGQNLSDLIRSALDALLERDYSGAQVNASPRSLTLFERRQLSLLHRILARVIGDENDVDGDKEYQLKRARVIEAGFTKEYSYEFDFLDPEMSLRDSEFVYDVLDLFTYIIISLQRLENAGTKVDPDLVQNLEFSGFDRNDPRESQMLDYVLHLATDNRWTEIQKVLKKLPDEGNSHWPMVASYERMLNAHRQIQASRKERRFAWQPFSVEELQAIADADHPTAGRSD